MEVCFLNSDFQSYALQLADRPYKIRPITPY